MLSWVIRIEVYSEEVRVLVQGQARFCEGRLVPAEDAEGVADTGSYHEGEAAGAVEPCLCVGACDAEDALDILVDSIGLVQ